MQCRGRRELLLEHRAMINHENERAGEVQRANRAALRGSYDYVIVGAGASGSVIAGELAKSGADVLLVESGGMDDGPTISNPSVWFYNIGGSMDWSLPIQPSPVSPIASSSWPWDTCSAAAAASMRWSGRAACSATSTAGPRT